MRKLILILAVLGLLVSVAAAQEETPEATPEATMQQTGPGFVRFAHFSPDAGPVDIYVDGEAAFEGVTYNTVSDWVALEPGGHNVAVAPEGAAVDEAVLSGEFDAVSGQWSDIVVTGNTLDDSLRTAVVQEDFIFSPPGVSGVTFVNAMSDDTVITFNRDGVAYVTSLGPLGNEDAVNSFTVIPMDGREFDFSANVAEAPDTVIGDQPETDIMETNTYLIAAIGTEDDSQIVVLETPRSAYALLTGQLMEPGDIPAAAGSFDILSAFGQAVEMADLGETLSGEGPFTVFAPADFVLDDVLADFEDDPEALARVLQNHVVEGDLRSLDLIDREEPLTTLLGEEVPVEVTDAGVTVGGATVIEVNLPATNGVVHVINDILLPEDMQE